MTQLVTQPVAVDKTVDAHDAPDPDAPASATTHAPLPLVALVLGAAGVVLGVTVIWFFAAIPIGIAAIVIGIVARRRVYSYQDPRAASRATIATALGCVAVLLGVTGAVFLPRVMDRADRFLSTIQHDVHNDVGSVNAGLTRDVNRLDRTLSRDLRRFERDNHRDLRDLEDRTATTLKTLEERMKGDVSAASVAAKRDLTALEAALRADLRTTQSEMRAADGTLHDSVAALEVRIQRIEHELGL